MRKDKARDIARGVLPSTARKSARDNKRNFHAKHRHAQRQANHAILRHCSDIDPETGALYTDPDLFDDFVDPEVFDGYHAATKDPSLGWDDMSQRGEIIISRRNADKLGPLISWATATERNKMSGWSVEDKIAYFKAILPDTLQGRHALGHVTDALGLYVDEFLYGGRHTPPEPISKDRFTRNLYRILFNSKARRALRDFIYETVPVAAHAAETNLKINTTVQAVDEEGRPRYIEYVNSLTGMVQRRPHMVNVRVPQTVAVSCDDCTFLRHDPLATTAAVNRFVDMVFDPRPYWRFRSTSKRNPHPFLREIFSYVYNAYENDDD